MQIFAVACYFKFVTCQAFFNILIFVEHICLINEPHVEHFERLKYQQILSFFLGQGNNF